MGQAAQIGLALLNPALAFGALTGAKGAEVAATETAKVVDDATGAKAQREKAAADAKDITDKENKLLDDQRTHMADEAAKLQSNITRDNALARSRKLSAGYMGAKSTVLTSPLGIPGTASAPKKTLLGT
jgi:Skp family chaperone for outer membrane proteins